MKSLFTLLCAFILAACGSSGVNTSPTVTDIQVKSLNYRTTAQFVFSGSNLATLDSGIFPKIPNCINLTPVSQVLGQQEFSCAPTVVGDLNVRVEDRAGATLFSKTFTVPPPQVAFVTTMGSIVVELNPTAAPLTVNNFLNYVQSGFYVNTIFHRVIAGFVAQGGGFTTGLAAKPGSLAPISLESNNGLSNLRGTVAMARTADPNSATSQFYFNLADNLSLDYKDADNPGYAVFGRVVQGLDVMDAIGTVATQSVNGTSDVPVTDVVIRTLLRFQ